MSDLGEKVKDSIARIKAFYPKDGRGYYLAFSGGKDSVVCKFLLGMAGVKFDGHYHVTSVDPPEMYRFIRDKHPDIDREVPKYPYENRFGVLQGKPITMWNLIMWKKTLPTRRMRFCCEFLKESGGDGRMTVTGVRWAESNRRLENQGIVTILDKKIAKDFSDNSDFMVTRKGGVVLVNDNCDSRRTVESCYLRHKTVLNPIIDWEDRDVWDFIRSERILLRI